MVGSIWLLLQLLSISLLSTTTVSAATTEQITRLRRRRANVKDCIDQPAGKFHNKDDTPPALVKLNQQLIQRAVVAARLSYVVQEFNIASKVNQYRNSYERFDAWEDLNDAHLVVKHDNVCYGVFRATRQRNLIDILQNIKPTNQRVPGTKCTVLKGFWNGYNTKYLSQFRTKLRQCIKSCNNNKKDCPLILTGHSQGAAIATVATMDLQKYKPTTLAFAPLQSVTNLVRCKKSIRASKIYNFINASGGIYDDAPFGSRSGKIMGRVFLLDEGNAVAYLGMHNNKPREPLARKIHAVELYRTRMTQLAGSFLSSPCSTRKNSLKIAKWRDGHWCSRNDECQSRHCSSQQQLCTSHLLGNKQQGNNNAIKLLRTSGSPCESDAACESGRCFRERCTLENGKLGIGANCVNNQDCDSGRCDNSGYRSTDDDPKICSPRRDVDSWCHENADCLSGNCSGRLPFSIKRCHS
ncbi:expressed unknown protein [Seminavis robusta]|uniref:Fungal lipase-type domain-containing protein n=1 Tax=Seminavis robusta TaxID=568900 RepID=A0A9N8DY34_9STRA|nr:expressed unknown protein [Seminavis robusta]|eukprot:Sro359_g126110.1 n/a (467) ;mRNA; r:40426-41826